MNRYRFIARSLYLTALLFLTINGASSQDTAKYLLDTSLLVSLSTSAMSFDYYSLHHSPTKDDSLRYHKHRKLITSEPSENNYKDYYSLACSLWELSKLNEAKNM